MRNFLTACLFFSLLFSVNCFANHQAGTKIFSGDTVTSGNSGEKIISIKPDIFINGLSKKVDESSGLIFFRDALWTHNDSGGEPEIYKIDIAKGKIIQTVSITNVENQDWEDISHDENYIYVGDFGNNHGNRKNLKILIINKKNIPENNSDVSVKAKIISFSMADQKIFEKRKNSNNYDCEAFFCFHDSLYLFTKNWVNLKTRMYVIPAKEGDYKAMPRYDFNADGLITGADINPAGNQLVLVGYKNYESFLWIFSDFENDNFLLAENRLRVNFPDLIFVQTEGVAYLNNSDIVFSCEESAVPPSVFIVNLAKLKNSQKPDNKTGTSSEILISELPEYFSKKVFVDILRVPNPDFTVEIRNRRWRNIYSKNFVMPSDNKEFHFSVNTEDEKSGVYFLRIISGESVLVKRITLK